MSAPATAAVAAAGLAIAAAAATVPRSLAWPLWALGGAVAAAAAASLAAWKDRKAQRSVRRMIDGCASASGSCTVSGASAPVGSACMRPLHGDPRQCAADSSGVKPPPSAADSGDSSERVPPPQSPSASHLLTSPPRHQAEPPIAADTTIACGGNPSSQHQTLASRHQQHYLHPSQRQPFAPPQPLHPSSQHQDHPPATGEQLQVPHEQLPTPQPHQRPHQRLSAELLRAHDLACDQKARRQHLTHRFAAESAAATAAAAFAAAPAAPATTHAAAPDSAGQRAAAAAATAIPATRRAAARGTAAAVAPTNLPLVDWGLLQGTVAADAAAGAAGATAAAVNQTASAPVSLGSSHSSCRSAASAATSAGSTAAVQRAVAALDAPAGAAAAADVSSGMDSNHACFDFRRAAALSAAPGAARLSLDLEEAMARQLRQRRVQAFSIAPTAAPGAHADPQPLERPPIGELPSASAPAATPSGFDAPWGGQPTAAAARQLPTVAAQLPAAARTASHYVPYDFQARSCGCGGGTSGAWRSGAGAFVSALRRQSS